MDKWLYINALDKHIACLKLAENDKICFDEKYLVKKFTLEVPTSKAASIIFDIIISEGKDSSSKVLYKTDIVIKKNRSILQMIDNIICGFSAYQTLPIDLVITKKNTGVSIGVMSPKYEANHINVNLAEATCNSTVESNNVVKVEPKELFVSNISVFVSAIETTYVKKMDIDMQNNEWISAFSKIPNSESLQAIYNTCEKDMNLWMNVLESWGVKVDKCTKYTYLAINKLFYKVPSDISNNSVLEVIAPAWTIWTETATGQKEEKVIIKGTVRVCQN